MKVDNEVAGSQNHDDGDAVPEFVTPEPQAYTPNEAERAVNAHRQMLVAKRLQSEAVMKKMQAETAERVNRHQFIQVTGEKGEIHVVFADMDNPEHARMWAEQHNKTPVAELVGGSLNRKAGYAYASVPDPRKLDLLRRRAIDMTTVRNIAADVAGAPELTDIAVDSVHNALLSLMQALYSEAETLMPAPAKEAIAAIEAAKDGDKSAEAEQRIRAALRQVAQLDNFEASDPAADIRPDRHAMLKYLPHEAEYITLGLLTHGIAPFITRTPILYLYLKESDTLMQASSLEIFATYRRALTVLFGGVGEFTRDGHDPDLDRHYIWPASNDPEVVALIEETERSMAGRSRNEVVHNLMRLLPRDKCEFRGAMEFHVPPDGVSMVAASQNHREHINMQAKVLELRGKARTLTLESPEIEVPEAATEEQRAEAMATLRKRYADEAEKTAKGVTERLRSAATAVYEYIARIINGTGGGYTAEQFRECVPLQARVAVGDAQDNAFRELGYDFEPEQQLDGEGKPLEVIANIYKITHIQIPAWFVRALWRVLRVGFDGCVIPLYRLRDVLLPGFATSTVLYMTLSIFARKVMFRKFYQLSSATKKLSQMIINSLSDKRGCKVMAPAVADLYNQYVDYTRITLYVMQEIILALLTDRLNPRIEVLAPLSAQYIPYGERASKHGAPYGAQTAEELAQTMTVRYTLAPHAPVAISEDRIPLPRTLPGYTEEEPPADLTIPVTVDMEDGENSVEDDGRYHVNGYVVSELAAIITCLCNIGREMPGSEPEKILRECMAKELRDIPLDKRPMPRFIPSPAFLMWQACCQTVSAALFEMMDEPQHPNAGRALQDMMVGATKAIRPLLTSTLIVNQLMATAEVEHQAAEIARGKKRPITEEVRELAEAIDEDAFME